MIVITLSDIISLFFLALFILIWVGVGIVGLFNKFKKGRKKDECSNQ